MKKTDTFYNIEVLSYDNPIAPFDFVLSESEIEHLEYLDSIGYAVVIQKGRATATGSDKELAKLIAGEIEDALIDQDEHHDLNDYIRFHQFTDEELVNEIQLAIKETIAEKAYDIRFIDVFEYISDFWVLNDKQRDQLKKRDWEDYQETKHPDDK